MSFYGRIALACLILLALLGVIIWRGPQVRDATAVARSPNGVEVSTGVLISITFSRPVDRRSVEERFTLIPETAGQFFWDGQTVTFRPDRALASTTNYQVMIAAGIRDLQGRANVDAITWSFRTRSPRLLLLERATDGADRLWLMNSDGSAAQELITEVAGIVTVAVAPDNQQAVYVTPRDPSRLALMLLNLEDRTVRPLVDTPDASARAPAWSPLRDVIAFERIDMRAPEEPPRVWLAQPDGTLLGPLLGNEERSAAPAWSPGGTQLAFLHGVDQAIAIYTFPASTTLRFFLGPNDAPISWSPDGTALVYTSAIPGETSAHTRIRWADPASGATRDLTDGTTSDASPAWSPDGEWIAFVRYTDDKRGSTLWIMRNDGSELRQITPPGPYQDTQPAWSPDSQQIAFLRSSVGVVPETSAWIVDRVDGTPRRVREQIEQVVWVP